MSANCFQAPAPRREVADQNLVRPDWTIDNNRDPNLLWLDKNENSDPELLKTTRRILSEIPEKSLWSYPESAPLYRKLALHLDVEPSNLLLSYGSDGAIRSAFEAYISPGDKVIFPKPTFAMYAVYSRMYAADARPLEYRPSERGPELPVTAILNAVKQIRPKMLCLPNPGSPTGTVFSQKELKDIIEEAGKSGTLTLIDEAYYPFHQETVLPWIKKYPHLMVTRSTGKAWGLAGFRLGYAAANRDVATILHKVRSMYEISAVAVSMMEQFLDCHEEMLASVERLEAGKKEFLQAMRNLGFQVLEGHGNFFHVAFGDYAEKIHHALSDLVYYRRDFRDVCLKGFSRFSSTTPEKFKPVIDRIRKAVGG
ncbi:Histidinol-phosphate aminotransferase [Candidatus Desulfarcum epimagneticum]|uniref:Aminotransferase n=1 Tax=uncultured Desulfobacteraceae bacterium TaxID=218296 RepID=A0A484HJ75_9BACT|nr:Histidinol-phosphate aminotransferase [uncultured Desulfobacteraceae bacterium]